MRINLLHGYVDLLFQQKIGFGDVLGSPQEFTWQATVLSGV
jgi:hypothetical protein